MFLQIKLRFLVFYYTRFVKHQTECNGKWYKFKFTIGADTFVVGIKRNSSLSAVEFLNKEYHWERLFDEVYKLKTISDY